MSTLRDLLLGIEADLELAGALMLRVGSSELDRIFGFEVGENGRPTASARTMLRAVGVMNAIKTGDTSGEAENRAKHAAGLVQQSVRTYERCYRRLARLRALESGEHFPAGDVRSRTNDLEEHPGD